MLRCGIAVLSLLIAGGAPHSRARAELPNVVIILADDKSHSL